LSGRGLCDELITRPEESYRLWCVVVCDLETSRICAPYIYDISNLRVNFFPLFTFLYVIYLLPIGNKSMTCFFLTKRVPSFLLVPRFQPNSLLFQTKTYIQYKTQAQNPMANGLSVFVRDSEQSMVQIKQGRCPIQSIAG